MQHFEKRTVAIDPLPLSPPPPPYSVYSFEDDDNSGRPLSDLCLSTYSKA